MFTLPVLVHRVEGLPEFARSLVVRLVLARAPVAGLNPGESRGKYFAGAVLLAGAARRHVHLFQRPMAARDGVQ